MSSVAPSGGRHGRGAVHIVLAAIVLCLGIAAAVAISAHTSTHQTDSWAPCYAKGYDPSGVGSKCFSPTRYFLTTSTPSWDTPVAVVVGLLGLALGVALVARRR
jgi:hypothetical protein